MNVRSIRVQAVVLALAGASLVAYVGCGGSSSTPSTGMGTASTSLSDPPSCKIPAGDYKNVYVTVTSVQIHTSATAPDNGPGWVELAPNLASAPMQIDLLGASTNCILAQLGSNVPLAVGDYQQIRLILLANGASGGPANNACASVQGFNCAILQDNSVHRLELSSQANTGLKIPPGQIVGGPIRVAEGQHVDINIDFNICASILVQPNGTYRLKPTLTAGQVSPNTTGISGQVVDGATQLPIPNGKVFVAIEQPDSNSVDRIVMEASADANGNFTFCPLPTGTYDIVAVAVDANGNAFGATVALGVPSGTAFGKIPLVAIAPAAAPATIDGVVSAANGAVGATTDVAMSALQMAGTRLVTIPLLPSSVGNVTTVQTPVSATCPANTFCEKYTFKVPASNPSVGTFAAGGTTFAPPAANPALYTSDARAFLPNGGGATMCTPNRIFTDKDTNDQPLNAAGTPPVIAKTLSFVACQ